MRIYNKYCVDIEELYNMFLRKSEAILCKGTALPYQGYSNTWGIPVQYYFTGEKPIIDTSYFKGYKLDSFDNLEIVDYNGVLCTSVERSICDMLADDESDDQIIVESIADYIDEHGNISNLRVHAEESRVTKQLESFLDDAESYYCY